MASSRDSGSEPSILVTLRIPRSVLILVLITILGLALRLLAAAETNGRLPDTPDRLIGDEVGYDWMARELLAGSFFPWPGKTPIYPMLVAASYWLFGYSFVSLLYFQAVVGASLIPLTFALARRLAGRPAALLAAGIVAIHPVLIRQGMNLLSELAFTPLLVVLAIALVWASARPSMLRFGLAGVALALLSLTRPAALYAVFILPLLLPAALGWKRRCGFSFVTAAAMALVIAPWSLHNFRQFHAFIPLSVSSAVLWQGSPEYYHLMEDHWTFTQMWSTYLDPDNNGGIDPFSVAGSHYFTHRAIASIESDPLTYAWYSVQKAAYFWIGHPMADWEWPFNNAALREYYPPLWQYWSIYLGRGFAVLGLLVLFAAWRDWPRWRVLVGLIGYFWAFHAATYAEARFSEPLDPFLAVFIAAWLTGLVHARARRPWPSRFHAPAALPGV